MERLSNQEIQLRLSKAAAVVKLVCGVANNAAWMVCLDAMDKAKQHFGYGRSVRGGGTVRGLFKRVVKAHETMERNLIYTETNRFFHVADMDAKHRAQFGAQFTDRDYFDFWASIGGGAYTETRPLITSLWNKYRLSLMSHHIPQADILAWVMTGTACLATSVTLYDMTIDDLWKGYNIPRPILRHVFAPFSLKTIEKLWMDAMDALDPNANSYELDATESKNIEYGLQQLSESWMSLRTLYDSVYDSTEDYSEIFRTKGEQKKALRQIAELRSEHG